MEQYVLYSTGCPKCVMLKRLLDGANLKYVMISDEKVMIDLGMLSAPQLELPNGKRLCFKEAFAFLRERQNGNTK